MFLTPPPLFSITYLNSSLTELPRYKSTKTKFSPLRELKMESFNGRVAATTSGSEGSMDNQRFPLFSLLPLEIRSQIWGAALSRRIIKWTHTKDQNVFTVASKSF